MKNKINTRYRRFYIFIYILIIIFIILGLYEVNETKKILIDSSIKTGKQLSIKCTEIENQNFKEYENLLKFGMKEFEQYKKTNSSKEDIQSWLERRSKYYQKNTKYPIHSLCMVVDGNFYGHGKNYKLSKNDMKNLEWYKTAIKKRGKVACTNLYTDNREKVKLISFVYMKSNDSKNNNDILVVNIEAKNILDNSDQLKLKDGMTYLLCDEKGNTVFSINKNLNKYQKKNINNYHYTDINVYKKNIFDKLSKKDEINIRLRNSNIFAKKLDNGWKSILIVEEKALFANLIQLGEGYLIFFTLFIICITLILFIVQKQKHNKEEERVINAMSSIFEENYCVSLSEGTFHSYKSPIQIDRIIGTFGKISNATEKVIPKMIKAEDQEKVRKFLDCNTVSKRLKNKKILVCEYETINSKTYKARIIPIIHNKKDEVTKVILLVENISEEKKMAYEAKHDIMTGVLNRRGMLNKVEMLKNTDIPIGFMILDGDCFKSINDTYGHEIGDKVLIKIANILKMYFKNANMIVRLGGDEFAILFINILEKDYPKLENKIKYINEQLRKKDDDLPSIQISAGVAFSKNGYIDELYLMADKALYQTKINKKGGCSKYTGE